MTYFPPVQERATKPSKCPKCPGCGDWYVPTPGMEDISCAVYHAPGTCCHYSETRVDPPESD